MDKLLSENIQAITWLIYNVNRQYKPEIKPKMKFGKPQTVKNLFTKLRHLLIPSITLKEIQSSIGNELQKTELPACMFGSVKGSNNIINTLQHIDNCFFLTIDLKDFFSRINNKQVYKVFIDCGHTPTEARIFTRLTTYKGSLPQGAPSSPMLGNLAFLKTAIQLESLALAHDITFTTFLDDLTFSSKKDFKHLIPKFLEIIKSNHFFPNHRKIKYQKNYCEITGLIIRYGKMEIMPKMLKEAKSNIRIRRYVENVNWEYTMRMRNANT
ncbi:MAG: reverse transcriptase family protein [Agriterribacter sp.]